MTTIAIIGAGLAGLAAARILQGSGAKIIVFDKSRGLGGRLATRRNEAGTFDHGAQYVRLRGDGDARFAAFLEEAEGKGAASRWTPTCQPGGEIWMVGQPGMSGLVAPLAEGVDIRRSVQVSAIRRSGEGVELLAGDEHVAHADGVIAAIPAPQARALLEPLDHDFAALNDVVMAPCLAAMLVLEKDIDVPDVSRPSAPALAWVARDGSKPGRSGAAFVLHAAPDWSRAHLERDAADIAADLAGAFLADHPGARMTHLSGHRWRYALAETPLGRSCLTGSGGRLIACGDWCLGARAEAAFTSGEAAANAMARSLALN